MKKLFTLIAGMLLVSSGAFAQLKWTNLVTNGNMEGEQSADWSSFWCHDWRAVTEGEDQLGGNQVRDEGGQFQGFAEIVEDPANPANHCARVIVRSDAEAQEAGNRVEANGALASWDCQFFIYATETIPEGKEVRMTLKVKGEKAGSFETQAHWAPGDYNHYQLFGNQSFGTEWTTIEATATVDANHTQEANGKFFQSVAFNLSTTTEGNVIYFDDVKLEIKDPEDPAEFEGWYNFLRNGTLSEDVMPQNPSFTNFTGRDGIDGIDRKARVVNDPVDGQPAMMVTTNAYTETVEKEVLDEDGNPVLDEEGNPTYETVNYWTKRFINEDGTTKDSVMTRNIDDWESQFFVSIPHTLNQGQQYKVTFWARADIPTQIQSQVHNQPGGYIYYVAIGNFDLTEEWQQFETEATIDSNQKGTWTIAFNCNVDKDEVNNIYFRFDEFSINSAEVKEEDRVLASESIMGSVPAKGADDPTELKIDLTTAMQTLGVDKISDLLEGAFIKVAALDENESVVWEETQPDYFIDGNGYFNANPEGINIAFNEEKSEGNIAVFDVFNDNIDLTSTIPTKLIFSVPEENKAEEGYARRAWSYQYNITLMSEQAYNEAMAVTGVKAAKTNGIIYDLAGRRVAKAVKGLYIKDGKKFFVK